MIKRLVWRAILLLGVLLVAALPARADFLDPAGDTFNTGTIDIVSIAVDFSGATLTFTVTFAGTVAAPSAFAANSVVGFIDLDTDQNATTGGSAPWGGAVTGGNSWINFFIAPNPGTPSIPGPLVALGDEYYVDLGSEMFHPGSVAVVDTSTNGVVGVAPVTYVGNVMTIAIPTALIGNPAGVNFGLLVGDFLSPTDRAPNGASPYAVPEPSSLILAGLGCLTACGYGWRRKKTLVAA